MEELSPEEEMKRLAGEEEEKEKEERKKEDLKKEVL